jgi:hypothetical protein
MRFTNKRSTTSRRAPASASSPVIDASEAVTPPFSDPAKASPAPSNSLRPANETKLVPSVEHPGSRGGRAPTTGTEFQGTGKPGEPTFADIPDELIAARAYELWQRRGCPMGHDTTEDWYAARAELAQERLGWATPQPADRDRI